MIKINYTDIAIFSAGWLARAVIFAIVAELVVKPFSKRIARYIKKEPQRVQHYLENHNAKRSYNCPICNP